MGTARTVFGNEGKTRWKISSQSGLQRLFVFICLSITFLTLPTSSNLACQQTSLLDILIIRNTELLEDNERKEEEEEKEEV